MDNRPARRAIFTGVTLLWLLFTIKIARLAERQGSDSLTREQLAELPREGSLPVALLWLGKGDDRHADGDPHGGG